MNLSCKLSPIIAILGEILEIWINRKCSRTVLIVYCSPFRFTWSHVINLNGSSSPALNAHCSAPALIIIATALVLLLGLLAMSACPYSTSSSGIYSSSSITFLISHCLSPVPEGRPVAQIVGGSCYAPLQVLSEYKTYSRQWRQEQWYQQGKHFK